MKSQSRLDAVQGDTVGIWKVSHITSAPGVKPVVRATLSGGVYSCTIRAVYADGTVAVAERAVTALSDDNFYFLAALLPSEMATVNVGPITVGIQLVNAALTPPLRKERHYPVMVHPSINANT